jgi:probable addiction module antidote protein
MKASRKHEDATVEMLKQKPELAEEYLRATLEEIDESGGEAAFLAALRNVALARGGITGVAKAAGMKREAVSRALSPRGNPSLRTLTAVCHAMGVRLDAHMV